MKKDVSAERPPVVLDAFVAEDLASLLGHLEDWLSAAQPEILADLARFGGGEFNVFASPQIVIEDLGHLGVLLRRELGEEVER
jgi:hypothetical protein